MSAVCSIFSQILQLFSRAEFQAAVRQHKAERHARGFTCWGQFIAMLFCQLGQAKSLLEICGGLALAKGNFVIWGCLRLLLAPPWPTPMSIGLGSCIARCLSNCWQS